jgi:hypothetical protein
MSALSSVASPVKTSPEVPKPPTWSPVLDLTAKDIANLKEIRERLTDLLAPDSILPGAVEARKMQDDNALLRFIMARPTVEAAASMVRSPSSS